MKIKTDEKTVVSAQSKILSVNLAVPRVISIKGKEVLTGIYKIPVEGPQYLGREGFERDTIVDLRKMGRHHHAVYIYPFEHYQFWSERLKVEGFPPGQFGENLTVAGFPETQVRMGDIFRCGEALIQVSQPRIPCKKLDVKMGRRFARIFLESRRVGYYLRVLEEGLVSVGDTIELVESNPNSPTMDDFIRVSQFDYWDPDALEHLLASQDLMEGWEEVLRRKKKRAKNTKGWAGKRALEIIERREEREDIISLVLRCPYEKALAPFDGGQFLMMTLRPEEDGRVLRRAYAITSDPGDLSSYRITILRRDARPEEDLPAGVLSSYLHHGLQVGDLVHSMAPAGKFFLNARTDGSEMLIFICEDIGIAPLISMLYECPSMDLKIPTKLFYYADDGAHIFKQEIIDLMSICPFFKAHFLSCPLPSAEISEEVLEEEECAERCFHTKIKGIGKTHPNADFFVAGRSGFAKKLKALLLAEEKINPLRFHGEFFGR